MKCHRRSVHMAPQATSVPYDARKHALQFGQTKNAAHRAMAHSSPCNNTVAAEAHSITTTPTTKASQLIIVARQFNKICLKLPYFLFRQRSLHARDRTQHLPPDVCVRSLEPISPSSRRPPGLDSKRRSFRVLDDVPPVEQRGSIGEVNLPARGKGYPVVVRSAGSAWI